MRTVKKTATTHYIDRSEMMFEKWIDKVNAGDIVIVTSSGSMTPKHYVVELVKRLKEL